MKFFDPSRNQLVLIAMLFTAVIAAHLVAPPSVQIITTLVSVLIARLDNRPLMTSKPKDDPAIERNPENDGGDL